MNKTAREFYKTIEGAATKKQKGGYDTQATVQRIEDGVCWVHIPGGVSETPAKLTINASVGDVVQVRVANGRAFLVGNASAPPTDDKEAVKALTMAGSAAQAAGIAWQKAEEATADAERAHEAADAAQSSADAAATAASNAQTSADNAQTSATTANQAANSALAGLGTVESVLDVVTWFSEHKTATADTTVQAGKAYYEYDASTGTLTKVDPEGTENPSEEGWYELDEAITNYVSTHLAQTNDGLYVVSSINGWRVLVSSGGGNYAAGVYLIDSSGNVAQQTTASGVSFNTGKPVTIGDQTAYINFDGNGHISVIGADLTIGGANNVSGVLTVKDASGTTIGTWDKDGINATNATLNNANVSGSVTATSGNNKLILNAGTLNGYYSNNLIGGLSIVRSTYDLTSIIQQLDPIIHQQFPVTSVTASVLKLATSNSVGFVTGEVGEIDFTTNNGNCGIIIRDVREYFHLALTNVDVDVARWEVPSLTFKGNSVFTDSIRIQRLTSNGSSFDTNNPQIQFCNASASQNIALVFTDYDSVQSPASLTLAGNQGGEYFIAPNIKATDHMEIGVSSDTATRYIRVQNSSQNLAFEAASSGNAGIWSSTHARWLVWLNSSGNCVLGNGAGQAITYSYVGQGCPIVSNETANHRVADFYMSSATSLRVNAQGNAASYAFYYITTSSSDIRLKEHIADTSIEALPIVDKIKVRQFDWKDGVHQDIGVIADEIEQLDDRLTIGGGYNEDGEMDIKTIDTFYLMGYLVKAVQELSARVKELERRAS